MNEINVKVESYGKYHTVTGYLDTVDVIVISNHIQYTFCISSSICIRGGIDRLKAYNECLRQVYDKVLELEELT